MDHNEYNTNTMQGWCDVSNEWHDDEGIDTNRERETEGMWVRGIERENTRERIE